MSERPTADELGERFELPGHPHVEHDFYSLNRQRLRLGDTDVAYLDEGSGPTLLLIHGLMTSAYSWRYLVSRFAESYRVIVPDLPGAGLTTANPEIGHGPAEMSAFISDFLDALEIESVELVGNSLGGVFSLRFAIEHRERVTKLAIMHSPGFPELRIRAMRSLLAVPPIRALFTAYLRRNPYRFVAKNVHYAKPLLSGEEILEYSGIFETQHGCRTFVRILRDGLAPAALQEHLTQVRSEPLEIPVMLLWARNDVMVPPKFGPRYEALLPGSELIWMDDVSHFMHVDDPGATYAHLERFLRAG